MTPNTEFSKKFSFFSHISTKQSTVITTLALILLPLLIITSTHTISHNGLINAAEYLFTNPIWFVSEYFMILFFICIIYAFTSLLSVSFFIPASILTLICMISYNKAAINGTPMLLNDFTLLTQFGEIFSLSSSQIQIPYQTILTIIIEVISLTLLITLDYSINKIKAVRISAALLSVLFIFFTPVRENILIGNDLTQTQEERIFKYGPLMGMYATYAHDKKSESLYTPDSINRVISQAEGLNEDTYIAPDIKPTVIFLMSESFFDVTRLPNIQFENDPIPIFHSLANSHTSGNFISNTYCGGTGYVEMEVLTSLCSNLLKETDTLTSLTTDDVYKRIPSLSNIFKQYGYHSVFIHSHNDALYNRRPIYTDLGFDEILFEESFTSPEYRGGYISDMELVKKIISTYEQADSKPMFFYTVSMENHQPFSNEKFNGEKKIKFNSDHLTDDAKSVFNGYLNGLHDADTSLGYLIDYFKKQNEPIMLIFFGDHLPNLGTSDGNSVYTQLGYATTDITTDWQPDELIKMLSTDYLIWTNYENEAVSDSTQSSTLLGLSVLDRLSFKPDKYYSWLNKYIAPSMLMYRSRLYVDRDNNLYSNVPLSHQQAMSDYKIAIYDIIYGDNLIFKQ